MLNAVLRRRALFSAVGTAAAALALRNSNAGAAPSPMTTEGPVLSSQAPDLQIVDRLREAIASHDPARVAACFTDDYRVEMPQQPDRSFTGAEHVQRTWTAMFAATPDLTANVLRTATSGSEIWSEWAMTGTGTDGSPVAFVGPVILTARDGRINWARFYLEKVRTAPG